MFGWLIVIISTLLIPCNSGTHSQFSLRKREKKRKKKRRKEQFSAICSLICSVSEFRLIFEVSDRQYQGELHPWPMSKAQEECKKVVCNILTIQYVL